MVDEAQEKKKDVQTIGDGVGPRYHRVYTVDLPVTLERARETMSELKKDINAFSPQWIATFDKKKGDPGELNLGDEILVRISGPWNGPVRVTEVTNEGFAFCTLDGHIEAGNIHFKISRASENTTKFEIESVTRSRDQIVNFFYDKIRFAMLAQTEMWELFCQNFAKHATRDEDLKPEVVVKTERQDEKTGIWEDVSHELGTHGTESTAKPQD
ncbi:MAG: DUF1990 family protein [Proteobacteria bacterium]|nr:MAG: DUF1990 family protein [Pseudomonadota bacterium]